MAVNVLRKTAEGEISKFSSRVQFAMIIVINLMNHLRNPIKQ